LNPNILVRTDFFIKDPHEKAQICPAIVTGNQVDLAGRLDAQIEAAFKVFR